MMPVTHFTQFLRDQNIFEVREYYQMMRAYEVRSHVPFIYDNLSMSDRNAVEDRDKMNMS